MLCERTPILGAACRAGEGGPEPRWARVSWGHPGQGLSVLPPGREAGAGRTARGGLGPRGPTVPPRCGVVSVTPNLVSLGQDPSFVRSTRSPGIFTSFLPHFVSVCCNRQETVRIRAPGAHDPGQPASDPDSGSGVRGPRVPPTIWPTAPRNLTFHPESRFPRPPPPQPTNSRVLFCFLGRDVLLFLSANFPETRSSLTSWGREKHAPETEKHPRSHETRCELLNLCSLFFPVRLSRGGGAHGGSHRRPWCQGPGSLPSCLQPRGSTSANATFHKACPPGALGRCLELAQICATKTHCLNYEK